MKNWILLGLIIVLMGSATADPFIGNTLRYSIDIKDGCDVTALGDTDVDLGTGDLTSTGALTIASATYSGTVQAEQLTSTDDITATDTVYADDASITNNTEIGGTLEVTGVTTTTGGVVGDVTGDLTGNATGTGTHQAEQITSTDDALVYDDLTCNDIIVNDTVDVGGNADIDGNLDVDGNTDLDLLNVSETLDVDGAATFDAVTIAEGVFTPITTVNASTYDILATDYMIGVTYSQYGTCALDFKTAQIVDGRTIHIFDSGGNSSGYTITVSTEGSEKINGADTATITSDYGSLSLICDGTNLFTF